MQHMFSLPANEIRTERGRTVVEGVATHTAFGRKIEPLQFPVTPQSIESFYLQDLLTNLAFREIQATEYPRIQTGDKSIDAKIFTEIALIINEMFTFAKGVCAGHGKEFIYSRVGQMEKSDTSGRPFKVSALAFDISPTSIKAMQLVHVFLQRALDVSVMKAYRAEMSYDKSFYVHVTWKDGNIHLLPKPCFRKQDITSVRRESYFSSLVDKPAGADMRFKVDGHEIWAHTLLLKQVEYFDAMLSRGFKEGHDRIAVFDATDHKTFIELLHYVYTGKVRAEVLGNMQDCLSLLQLAEFIGHEDLKTVCMQHVFEKISDESYISVTVAQLQMNDPDLQRLCDWFSKLDLSFSTKLDLESIRPLELLTLYYIAKKHQVKNLDVRCSDCLKRRITLEAGFVELCQQIMRMKSPELKKVLVDIVKEKRDMYTKMMTGKKGDYQAHWKAYKDIMLDPSLM